MSFTVFPQPTINRQRVRKLGEVRASQHNTASPANRCVRAFIDDCFSYSAGNISSLHLIESFRWRPKILWENSVVLEGEGDDVL
ncbi:hypothetical protein CEXT_473851 [Caerostris extrusa]|uniref:Uncharacterized protein n=1 Tax=Caerostris extrusa TaxID=172846 RepID=A0AAV4UMS5_CAEEX|nr:hypothetical protein CEXT_473851 [Caerostris extrusa]